MTLEHAYLIGMSGPALAVVGLPLVWWKPAVFGFLAIWACLLSLVAGAVLMTLA